MNNLLQKMLAHVGVSKESKYRLAIAVDIFCILAILTYGTQSLSHIISPLPADSPLARLFHINSASASSPEVLTLPNGNTVLVPDIKGVSTKNISHKSFIVTSANEFMSMAPDSLERRKKEVALMQYLTHHNASASDMVLALQATGSKAGRAWGMEYLWTLRQSGQLTQYHIDPLDEKKVKWAQEHNVDPRALAIATDVYGPTLKVLGTKPELFFEAAKGKAQDNQTYKYVPNPAVIAKLQMMETGWSFDGILNDLDEIGVEWEFSKDTVDRAFVNIGSVNAWDALNLSPEWFPSGHDDLVWIASNLEGSSGLPYMKNVRQIPGSIRTSGDGSGGAIGPQFMPLNARLFMTWYEKANTQLNNQFPSINPFSPWTGTLMTYLYLSSEFYHRQLNIYNTTDVVRPGYALLDTDSNVRYDPKQDPRVKALLKWNPLYWEAKSAVEAGDQYSSIWKTNEIAMTTLKKYE